jgi:hypothetical protein
MEAIKPFAATLAPDGGASAWAAGIFCRFSKGFAAKITTVLTEILGCHAALIKKWRRG